MVANITALMRVISNFLVQLLYMDFGGINMMSWMKFLWILFIVGCILKVLYGRGDSK